MSATMTEAMTDAPPTYPKKRIEVVIEAPLLPRLLDALDGLKVTGYSVVKVVAGRGRGGAWRLAGQVSEAGGMAMVVCVTDPSKAPAVLDALRKILARQIGVVTVGDVEVLRADHF